MTVQTSITELHDDFRALRTELTSEDGVLHRRITNHEIGCALERGEIKTKLAGILWVGAVIGGAVLLFQVNWMLGWIPPAG